MVLVEESRERGGMGGEARPQHEGITVRRRKVKKRCCGGGFPVALAQVPRDTGGSTAASLWMGDGCEGTVSWLL